MSLRKIVSIVSFVAIILLLVLSWRDIIAAWRLLTQVQLGILLLVIPLQFLSYYASGEILASFLRAKGELKHVSRLEVARFALEFNFVNHILPTGGLSGASYANWRFKHMGVSAARATLANALRFLVSFVVFALLLCVAVFALALDGNVNRLTILFASVLTTLVVVGTLLFVYVISSVNRMHSAGRQFTRFINGLLRRLIRKRNVLDAAKVAKFLSSMHEDYVAVRQSPRQLRLPAVWALAFIVLEVAMFMVVFASLSTYVNPAALLVAYGFASFAAAFVATPGGAGAYEAVMISFLGNAGVAQGTAIAGVLLGRVLLIVLTIVSGYVFYQLTLIKYGKKAQLRDVDPPAA